MRCTVKLEGSSERALRVCECGKRESVYPSGYLGWATNRGVRSGSDSRSGAGAGGVRFSVRARAPISGPQVAGGAPPAPKLSKQATWHAPVGKRRARQTLCALAAARCTLHARARAAEQVADAVPTP